jgi:putative DNA primase/helicase
MSKSGFTISETAPLHLHGCDLTEDGVAQQFTKLFCDKLRFCHSTGKWFVWSGKSWRRDETKLAFSWARQTCRNTARENKAQEKDKTTLAKAAFASAIERFAQADQALAVTISIWDADPFLLGTPGGTIDLRTGTLQEPVAEDYITKLTAIAPTPHANCPLWLAFLNEATGNDAALIRFLQQWAGYCLTGDTREHALLFVYGGGGNGKGVWLNTMAGIMGEYAKVAAMESFTASQSDKHPTDLAMLRGARMVNASETEEGRAWAEVRIKQLTGGDTITARFMRKDFFEFKPQFKLTVIGNHKPTLRNVDNAAKRRFNIVPFTKQPENPDSLLEEKLREEWPGILRWMIDGCLDWQHNGLVRPEAVKNATASYFIEQDIMGQWIDDCCDVSKVPPHCAETNASLFASWKNYAMARGEEAGTSKRLYTALERQGFQHIKDTAGIRGRGFKGIQVRVASYDPD